ncbi:MAG: methyltransferase [Candidatus Eisenbacteria bacterium]|nr:methyltransferase [Candidatus Eisenbacteria bacterium]
MAELLPRTYRLILKPGRDRSVRWRHPWIFSGSVGEAEALPEAAPGDLGEIYDHQGELLAVATVNPASQIVGRVLDWTGAPINEDWLAARLQAAWNWRRAVLADDPVFRWVNGEGDGLPGLILDHYAGFAVLQPAALIWSRLEEPLCRLVEAIGSVRGVIDKTETAVRDPQVAGEVRRLAGEEPPELLEIPEGGARLLVDLKSGQKTGLYLDQRANRLRLGRLAGGRRVLIPFAYTGGFGVQAALNGAERVVMIESSAAALELARRNWELNGLDPQRLSLIKADAWDELRRLDERFDLIILDPPALAKSARHLEGALRGYKDINLQALRRLAPGGWLATFSCSQHVAPDAFRKAIFNASSDAGVRLQCVARLGPGLDHPVALDHPQGEYLKGWLLRPLRTEAGDGQAPPSRTPAKDAEEKGTEREPGKPFPGEPTP